MKLVAVTALACAATMTSANAADDEWPSNIIKLVIPYNPGGGADSVGRVFVAQLTAETGWNVIIENKAGAGGMVGTESVARATPDGYTWIMGTLGPIVTSEYIYGSIDYDPRTFVPAGLVGQIPNILITSKDSNITSIEELVALSKTKPGGLTFSSAGIGTPGHLASELFKLRTGINARHIPYKAVALSLTDIREGRIDFAIDNLPLVIGSVESGDLVALASTGSQRSKRLPDVPTMDELGIDAALTSWFGILLPPETPPAIVEKVQAAMEATLANPETVAKLEQLGVDAGTIFGTAYGDFLEAERQKWQSLIEAADISIDAG